MTCRYLAASFHASIEWRSGKGKEREIGSQRILGVRGDQGLWEHSANIPSRIDLTRFSLSIEDKYQRDVANSILLCILFLVC